MKIVIFGTGGVGGYYGGRLAQQGADVTFLARGAHLAAICESGLRVESVDGDFTIHPAQATDSAHSIGEADLVILATKAWQLDEAISEMKPLIGKETVILPLLNGMEHMQRLFDVFSAEHVIGGLCRISVFIAAPGVIRHVGVKPYIAYGEWDNTRSERIQRIHTLFNSISGIVAENPADIQQAMWEKFIFITGTSGVGAYARTPLGEYRADPKHRALLIDAFNETAAVARAMGVLIDDNFVNETVQRLDLAPAGMMASMQKDMMAGRPSELNEQIGAVVRMGRAAGVPTPTHEKLLAALMPLEQKARHN